MRGDSSFEEHIRQLPLFPCDAFLDDGEVVPIGFVPHEQLAVNDGGAVGRAYPKITAAGWHHTLKADGPLAAQRGMRVAALFSGGPAAGGHNVIVGIRHALQGHTLLGVRNGPKGLLAGDLFEITDADILRAANTGGFDLLGTDRTKLKTPQQMEQLKAVCKEHRINAIIVIGGDDSNTNAAVMAEALFNGVHADGSGVCVIGVPKTMDGDVQLEDLLPISFGYATATRIYAEMVGNILQDTASSRKYWHFIKLMGRTASQVTLEVGLQCRPTIALISEEVAQQRLSLSQVVESICATVQDRASRGMRYGVVIIPEGLLEFIPEIDELIAEIERIMAADKSYAGLGRHDRREFFVARVQHALFKDLPHYIQDMLVADRDSHGNLEVSQIPTERLIADMVAARLPADAKFNPQTHFFGYEGRCGAPTAFDAWFSYNLGLTAGSLALDRRTGYMAAVTDFDKGGVPLALPLTGIIDVERRGNEQVFVIQKALVKLDSPAFTFFAANRDAWAKDDCFRSPGPRQLWGPVANEMPLTVVLNRGYRTSLFRQ